VLGPVITPYNPERVRIADRLRPPEAAHWLGTDQFGRDELVRLVNGGRYTLFIGVSSVLIGLVVGVPLGAISGYFGGWPDLIAQRIIDIVLSFPGFLLALHELAANALSHADRPAAARAWLEDRTFVCEVESRGEELSETTAGYLPPDPEAERARGLWLVRQLCDLVEVRSRGGRTAIRIHVARA